MADDKTFLIVGGLGLLYLLFSRSASAGPSPYPPGTAPGGGIKPPTSGGGGGISVGGGGSPGGGGGVPGGTSGGGTAGTGSIPRTTYICSDGSLVTDPSLCPVGPSPVGGECADSTYVDDVATQCPENMYTYTDTMDPCDPSSIAYNTAICGTPTGGNTGYIPPITDTMDPCDPSSVMYDPNQCGSPTVAGGSGYACYDTGDICNPDDCSYDPNQCSG